MDSGTIEGNVSILKDFVGDKLFQDKYSVKQNIDSFETNTNRMSIVHRVAIDASLRCECKSEVARRRDGLFGLAATLRPNKKLLRYHYDVLHR